MKPTAILTFLFFATLLVNYFIGQREGLANTAPTPSSTLGSQVNINQNNIKKNTTLIKQKEQEIDSSLVSFIAQVKKLSTQVDNNSVPVYNKDILHIFVKPKKAK